MGAKLLGPIGRLFPWSTIRIKVLYLSIVLSYFVQVTLLYLGIGDFSKFWIITVITEICR